jgi:hypothetical protein
VRQEVPILGDYVEKAGGGHRRACSSGICLAKQQPLGSQRNPRRSLFPAFPSWHQRP